MQRLISGRITTLNTLQRNNLFELHRHEEIDSDGEGIPERFRLLEVDDSPFAICENDDVSHPKYHTRCRVDLGARVRRLRYITT